MHEASITSNLWTHLTIPVDKEVVVNESNCTQISWGAEAALGAGQLQRRGALGTEVEVWRAVKVALRTVHVLEFLVSHVVVAASK